MKILGTMVGILFFCSCQKAPTTWDTDLSIPILNTTLNLSALIPDSLLTGNSDGEAAIMYRERVLDIGLDSLLELGSDTVSRTFTIAPLSQFTFNPGQSFYSSTNSFVFSGIEAELTNAILKSGNLVLSASNNIQSDLIFRVQIPKAKKNGLSFSVETIIPPRAEGFAGIGEVEIDLSDYELDLRGQSGSDFNTLDVSFVLSVPDEADAVTVSITEEVDLSVSYNDLKFSKVNGYFGTENIDVGSAGSFTGFPALNEAMIDIDALEANLSISNGFGIEVRAFLNQLKFSNSINGASLSLQNSIIGSPINISRASLSNGSLTESTRNFSLDQNNSNIDELLEILPDSLTVIGNADINPLGNISNYNDFATDESRLSADLEVLFPLKLSIDNLILRDTSSFGWSKDEIYFNQGYLFALAQNSFPMDASLSIKFLDRDKNPILNLDEYLLSPEVPVIFGRMNMNTSQTSFLQYLIDEDSIDILQRAEYIVYATHFRTSNYPEKVVFQSIDKISIRLSVRANFTTEID